MTHIAIGKLVTPVKDLPDNIVEGFDSVFKFAQLESNSMDLKSISKVAMAKCNNYNPDLLGCPSGSYTGVGSSTSVNTASEKSQIVAIFESTLSTVQKVANDKYFGVAELQPTAYSLNEILTEVNSIGASMQCGAVVPSYCEIWMNADSIVTGMGQVNDAINKFKNGDETKAYKDNVGFFTFLHCLPYFTVIGMVFLTFFHWKGGVCCCCSGGSKCACLALIPFFLFWLVSFVIFLVIFVTGWLVKNFSDRVIVHELNGSPNLDQAIDHIQTQYPDFWNLVFADLESALKVLFTAGFFFTIVNIVIAIYSSCQCCCRPFKKEEDLVASS
jgi:hypothetical protein